jgi:hypothetical protein
VSRRILIGCSALLAVSFVLIIGVIIGVVIGRESRKGGSVKTPLGEVTVEQPSTTTVTLRVSGAQGIRYEGTIGTSETGQRSIEGTLGTTPDDYELPLNMSPGSTDSVSAQVGRHPRDPSQPGTLKLGLLAEDGRVLKEQESSSDTGVVTFTYDAIEAREEL